MYTEKEPDVQYRGLKPGQLVVGTAYRTLAKPEQKPDYKAQAAKLREAIKSLKGEEDE